MSVQGKVAACQVWYKFRSEGQSKLRKGPLYDQPDVDTNPILDLIQNEARIPISYNPDEAKYDILYQELNESGKGFSVKLSRKLIAGKLDGAIDDEVLNFVFRPEYGVSEIRVGNIIRIEDEYLVVATALLVEDVFSITVEERGAHGSAADVHDTDDDCIIYNWTVRHRSITVVGYTAQLPAPTSLTALGITDGMFLTWAWSGSMVENAFLSHFRVYYSTSPGVDENSSYKDIGRDFQTTFKPVGTGVLPEIDVSSTYYFKVAAVNRVGVVGHLSGETSASVGVSPIPPGTDPDDPTKGLPPTPDVDVVVTGEYRLEVRAYVPATEGNIATRIADIKICRLELYRGTNVDTVNPIPSDELVTSEFDDSDPFEMVAFPGYTLPSYFWGRAYFKNKNDVVGYWGASIVLTLDAETNTSDLDVVSGIVVDQDAWGVDRLHADGVHADVTVLISCNATINTDSALYYELQWRIKRAGEFSTTTGFTNTDGISKSTVPFPGTHEVHNLNNSYEWEFTVAVENAYGWSAYITPVTMGLDDAAILARDNDITAILAFGAWTIENPKPGGNPQDLQGNETFLEGELDPDESSSTYAYTFYGYTGTLPAENVYIDSGSYSLFAYRGQTSHLITGYTATLNQFVGDLLRFGKDEGKQVTGSLQYDVLEEWAISANTAGDPFTVTVKGGQGSQNSGTLANWAIIEKPLWRIVDRYVPSTYIDTSGNLETWGTPVPDRIVSARLNATGFKWFMRARNYWGRSPKRFSDATAQGTLASGSAIFKALKGIDTPDIADDAITTTKITDGAVLADKMSRQGRSFSSKVSFTPFDWNTTQWNSATVTPVGETPVTVNSGNTGNMTVLTYIYFDGTTTLKVTTDLDTLGEDNILLCTTWPGNGTSQDSVILPVVGVPLLGEDELGQNTIKALHIVTGTITANEIFAGTITANEIAANTITSGQITTAALTGLLIECSASGQIRTSASGARVHMDSTGFRTYDASNNKLVELPTSGGDTGQIVLTASDTVPGKIVWGSVAEEYCKTGGYLFLPSTDQLSDYYLGYDSVSRNWENIYFEARDATAAEIVATTRGNLSGRYAELRAQNTGGTSSTAQIKAYYTATYQASVAAKVTTTSANIELVLGALTYTWPTSAPGVTGYVLSSTTAGVMSWVAQTGGGATSLDDLSDVTITTPATGSFLRYDGALWIDILPNLSHLSDVTITSPADHQILYYDNGSSLWKNNTTWLFSDLGTMTNSGCALTGTLATIATSGSVSRVMIQTTATDGNAELSLKNDVQEWKILTDGSLSDRLVIRDQTLSTNILAMTATGTLYPIATGVADLGGGGNRWNWIYSLGANLTSTLGTPLIVSSSAGTVNVQIVSTAVTGQAVLQLVNSSTYFNLYLGTDDHFRITDGGVTRFEITDTGLVYLSGTTNFAYHFFPRVTGLYDLGSTSYYWRDLFIGDSILVNGSDALPIHVYSTSSAPKVLIESTTANSVPGLQLKNDVVTCEIGVTGTDELTLKYGATNAITINGTDTKFVWHVVPTGTTQFIGTSSQVWNRGYFTYLYTEQLRSPLTNAEISHRGAADYKGTLLQITAANDAGITAGEYASYRGVVYIKRRSTATTKAGILMLEAKDGDIYYLHVGTDDKLYISAANTDPGTGDLVGTIVGSQ